jgi:hypothetical protein
MMEEEDWNVDMEMEQKDFSCLTMLWCVLVQVDLAVCHVYESTMMKSLLAIWLYEERDGEEELATKICAWKYAHLTSFPNPSLLIK